MTNKLPPTPVLGDPVSILSFGITLFLLLDRAKDRAKGAVTTNMQAPIRVVTKATSVPASAWSRQLRTPDRPRGLQPIELRESARFGIVYLSGCDRISSKVHHAVSSRCLQLVCARPLGLRALVL